MLLTAAQINRLDKPQVEGRRVQIRLSARQVAKNVSYTGGFIMSLARALPFVARVLPTILSGLATGLLSGGINKAISGSDATGDGIYLHKHDECYRVEKCKGKWSLSSSTSTFC